MILGCLLVLSVTFCLSLALAQEAANNQVGLGAVLQDYSKLGEVSQNVVSGSFGMGDMGMAKIIAYLVFGAIGFSVFIYGKKNAAIKPMIIGILLMGYTYFVTGTLAIYLIGAALLALLYFLRD